MFKALQEKMRNATAELSGMSRERREAIAARFQDPIATRTDWRPLRQGGANFTTHTLRRINARRLEIHASGKAKLFFGFFILALGIAFPIIMLVSLGDGRVGLFFVGLLAGVMLLVTIGQFRRRSVFDLTNGYFWAGTGASPRSAQAAASSQGAVQLADIHALQIIPERVFHNSSSDSRSRSRSRNYMSYELNLVQRDGERVNVMDHANLGQIQSEAQQIAKFLGIPVWDACKVP